MSRSRPIPADRVIVNDDNPRARTPAAILRRDPCLGAVRSRSATARRYSRALPNLETCDVLRSPARHEIGQSSATGRCRPRHETVADALAGLRLHERHRAVDRCRHGAAWTRPRRPLRNR